mmetsp:Transcript_36113/g.86086  ORF Transcript_36113/g.86086 Transcript_36113/m.86086 type:complete len:245 (+) Transcript_36113:1078-1812(+)
MYSQTIETLRLDYHFLRNRNTKAICVEANGSRLDQVVRWHTEKFPPEVFRMVGVCLYFYRQQAIRHWHGRCRWLESRRYVVCKALQIRRGGTAVCANCGLQEGFEVLGYTAVDSWKIGIRTTISPGDNPNQGVKSSILPPLDQSSSRIALARIRGLSYVVQRTEHGVFYCSFVAPEQSTVVRDNITFTLFTNFIWNVRYSCLPKLVGRELTIITWVNITPAFHSQIVARCRNVRVCIEFDIWMN